MRAVIALLFAGCCGVPVTATAQGSVPLKQVPAAAVPAVPASKPTTTPTSDEDARRAAAARLLTASRFRERQAVLLKDALRAAEAELGEECLNRAAAGQDMKACEAIAAPGAAMKVRLAASTSDMLDEVMAASQTIYARKFTAAEMNEVTRFFRTPVGQRYGALYPQLLTEVQLRKRAIARSYLMAAAAATAKAK